MPFFFFFLVHNEHQGLKEKKIAYLSNSIVLNFRSMYVYHCSFLFAVGVVVILGILVSVCVFVGVRYVRRNRNVTATYKRTFAQAGTRDELVADEGTVILSDEEL